MKNKITVGVIGYGNFGQFISKHLEKYFVVFIYDPTFSLSSKLKTVCACDYLIFAVTINNFELVCKQTKNLVSGNTKIIDVTSVKVLPLQILQKFFPNNEILGTHPIFGPQSGKNGIENLPIVLCNVSFTEKNFNLIKKFLSNELKLNIIEKSPSEHDKEMAYVQGLSHFIGRALSIMNIQSFDSATKSYKQLISLENLIGSDSWDLYTTIQNANPYTEKVRIEFLETLKSLEVKLNNPS